MSDGLRGPDLHDLQNDFLCELAHSDLDVGLEIAPCDGHLGVDVRPDVNAECFLRGRTVEAPCGPVWEEHPCQDAAELCDCLTLSIQLAEDESFGDLVGLRLNRHE